MNTAVGITRNYLKYISLIKYHISTKKKPNKQRISSPFLCKGSNKKLSTVGNKLLSSLHGLLKKKKNPSILTNNQISNNCESCGNES